MRKSTTMIDLTIDVGILMTGSGIGNPENSESCHLLMRQTLDISAWYLALDERGRIRHQYETKMKEGTFGYHWLLEMASRNKIIKIA